MFNFSKEEPGDYSSKKMQDRFLKLPLQDQKVLIEHHQSIANIINGPKTIEIAGYKILARPLESIALTIEQQKKFEEAGGLIDPPIKMSLYRENHESIMMHWSESFENMKSVIDGISYTGFDLWKKVYEGFPEYLNITKEQATAAELYPIIHYRNHLAREWMAKMNGGHLATLDSNYQGELRDIYNATEGETNQQKLASMGQAPLGWQVADNMYTLDVVHGGAHLGSGSINSDGDVRVLFVGERDLTNVKKSTIQKKFAVSSVIILDN